MPESIPPVRYQVFISSTFVDLKPQRQAILQALLELDCIPVGMELFPAVNEQQWTYIKRAISQCDYYVVISAGKYGSLGPRGISYTEMEYRYACEIKKPVIALLHENPWRLPARLREVDPARQTMLEKFRKRCQRKLCKLWSSRDSLVKSFTTSLVRLMHECPSPGWISGKTFETLSEDYGATQHLLRQVLNLHQVDFRFAKRRMTHRVLEDGTGLLEDEVTIQSDSGTLFFYITKYGLHGQSRTTEPCRPIVTAFDSRDKSPLSVCILKQNALATCFVVLFGGTEVANRSTTLTVICERARIWDGLMAKGQVDNDLTVERPCDELTMQFEAPPGRSWNGLRSTPVLGSVSKESVNGISVLTWRLKALNRMRIDYRLSFDAP
jgi:hypothetical protein